MSIQTHLNTIQRNALLVYAALFMSLVAYVAVAFLIADGSGAATTDVTQIRMAMTLAAIVAGGSSVLVPRWMMSDRNLQQVTNKPLDLERLARRQDGTPDPDRLRALQDVDASSLKLLSIAQRWMPSVILGCALAEAVAVCGLVLSIISKQPMHIVPFAGASALLMLSHFPRLAPLIERAKQLQQR